MLSHAPLPRCFVCALALALRSLRGGGPHTPDLHHIRYTDLYQIRYAGYHQIRYAGYALNMVGAHQIGPVVARPQETVPHARHGAPLPSDLCGRLRARGGGRQKNRRR